MDTRRSYVAEARYAGSEPPGNQGVPRPSGWLYAYVSTTTDMPAMTAQDRCDACGAQAYVKVQMEAGELLFCAHHARRHQEALRKVATEIHDETDRLHAEERATE
ncbi:hypothetical protein GCM10023169_39870 [Georgenia halophila]|uniref:DUF7455 domain-containing protein n=2 Tax=Georgenia halophila TaxID=620889 RepID=A0ABP8LP91_9MICO